MRTIAGVFFVWIVFAPSAAMAQPMRLVLSAEGALTCTALEPCEVAADCQAGQDCSRVGEDAGFWCNYLRDAFLCCGSSGAGSADADCRTREAVGGGAEANGVCADVGDLDGSGVCKFGDADTGPFCPGGDPLAAIALCMTDPETHEPTESWAAGDCDGDGFANAVDFGLGCGACDAANYPNAAGDGCIGDVLDAGPPDAAPGDTGTPPPPPPPPVFDANFRGAGGCDCDVAGNDRPAAPLALFFAGFVLLVLRSSRRAGRGS